MLALNQNPKSEPVVSDSTNPVYLSLKEDKIPLDYVERMHIMYGGMEIYGDKMKFGNCKDFVDIEGKFNTVRDLLDLKKRPNVEGDITVDDTIYNIVQKYEDKTLDSDTKSAFVDDLHTITSGLEEYISESLAQ